jgi:hypothetical protein
LNSDQPQAAKTNGAQAGTDAIPPPPLFYKRPVPVTPTAHADFRIRPETDFSFAGRSNAVPLSVPEFVVAARHYPIIFVGDELVPMVALGLSAEDNLFVNIKGEWEAGFYIPAYVRRYPFILLGAHDAERLQLGIDDGGRSTKPDALNLFDGEKETEVLRQGMSLCEQFHGAFRYTADFSAALKAANITESRTLEIPGPDGKKLSIGAFTAVIEEKFKAIPDDLFLSWRQKGWLHPIFFHLQSLNNWEVLLARTSTRLAVASALRR